MTVRVAQRQRTHSLNGRTVHNQERHMGKFAGKAGKAKPKASAFARAAAKSETAEPKGDEFDVGKFRVRLKDCQESENGSFGITFTGAGDDEEIGERIQWFSTKGKAAHVSGPRVKSLAMALLGMGKDREDEYNEFDPHGEFLDAILRFELDAAAEYMADKEVCKSADEAREALDEAEVLIKVTKGGEKDDGGFFRNASFAPVDSEDEDDSDDEDEDERPAKGKGAAKTAKKKASKRRPVEEDDEDEEEKDDGDDSDDEDEEPESERRPAKKKARRK